MVGVYEGARDGDHARALWRRRLHMHNIGLRYDALATDGDTRNSSSARNFALFISTLQRLVPPYLTSLHKCKAWHCGDGGNDGKPVRQRRTERRGTPFHI